MKNLFKNLVLFVALSAAFSSFTACNTASSEKRGAVIEVAPNNVNISSVSPDVAQNVEFPPAPAAIMQSDVKDLEGKTFKIEDKKGKVILVNLWATWCQPCRAEMPELVALQAKYKDKNFEILGLNADDESPAAIKSFGEEMKLNYFLGIADDKLISEMMRLSRQQGIPQSVLINREGKTVGVFYGSGAKAINGIKESVEKAVN